MLWSQGRRDSWQDDQASGVWEMRFSLLLQQESTETLKGTFICSGEIREQSETYITHTSNHSCSFMENMTKKMASCLQEILWKD